MILLFLFFPFSVSSAAVNSLSLCLSLSSNSSTWKSPLELSPSFLSSTWSHKRTNEQPNASLLPPQDLEETNKKNKEKKKKKQAIDRCPLSLRLRWRWRWRQRRRPLQHNWAQLSANSRSAAFAHFAINLSTTNYNSLILKKNRRNWKNNLNTRKWYDFGDVFFIIIAKK